MFKDLKRGFLMLVTDNRVSAMLMAGMACKLRQLLVAVEETGQEKAQKAC